MIQNKLFRDCLASIPEEPRAECDISFGSAERSCDVLRDKGMSQTEFAARMNKRESEVSRWLTGRHNFTVQTIAKIETALQCKLIAVV